MNKENKITIDETITNIDDAVSNLVDANQSIHIDIDLSDIIYDLNRLSERLENKLTK
tara:strand:+ start:101 stop:271 length:171 start_codon:yes stop_codon:yes gene_type:complete